MYRNPKKGITEVTSYVLLTLLIVVISTIVFLFSQGYLEQVRADASYESMENQLKQVGVLFEKNSHFDRSGFSYYFSFEEGALLLEDNEIKYISLKSYEGEEECVSLLCYRSEGGAEVIAFELPAGFSFSEEANIMPGSYTMYFELDKNEGEYDFYLR